MKLSLTTFRNNFLATFLRFPLTLLFAATASVTMMFVANREVQGIHDNTTLGHVAMSAYLAMLLFLAASFIYEHYRLEPGKKVLAFLLPLLLVAGYYISLDGTSNAVKAIRFILFSAGLHLLISFAPFPGRGLVNGFWQYNKILFLRFLLSALYSGVIFGGLAFALLAIDQLFSVKIKEQYYADLWFFMAGIFNTWFFLSGIPREMPSAGRITDYPKGLKVFTVYVLLPLVCIYLLILYVYTGKIVITSNWPYGWVGYLVIAYSVFGTLSFLLIYPLRDDAENKWVNRYSRMFYFLIIPLIILLFIAIFKRVNMYGITELRYFVILIAGWLSFITLYFILTNGKNIKIIPVSLCLLCFLSSFGPWGAFEVSKRSQVNELRMLLEKNNMLTDGTVDTLHSHDVTKKDGGRIRSIVSYLEETHGYESMQPLFKDDLSKALPDKKDSPRQSNADIITGKMRLAEIASSEEYVPGEEDDERRAQATAGSDSANKEQMWSVREFSVHGWDMINVRGYDYVQDFDYRSRNKQVNAFKYLMNGDSLSLLYDEDKTCFELRSVKHAATVINMRGFFEKIYETEDDHPQQEKFIIESKDGQADVKLVFTKLKLAKRGESFRVEDAKGIFAIRRNTSGTP